MSVHDLHRYEPDRVDAVGNRAVVVGASMAGLSAARVLADAVEEVVVLERDWLPDEPVARPGAPQTSHPHVLLEAGRATLEDFFPGFGEDVLAGGGLMLDAGRDMRYFDQGDYLAPTRTRLPSYCASRPLFEHVVRHHVRSMESVEIRDETHFTGFMSEDQGNRITGVEFRTDGESGATLSADLVVDATGRTSRTPKWLAEHGFAAPQTEEVTIDVTYSTLRIDRPADDRRMRFVPPSAPRTRGGGLIPVEDGRWEVIVQGVHGDRTPGEADAFLEFLESLPIDEPAELVRRRDRTDDGIDQYPYPSSLRRRYDALERFPEGLVVTGDAVASFNPVNGQGMSVAALDALELHHALAARGLDGIGRRHARRVADVVDTVWSLSVGADFQFAETTGPKPRGTDVLNRYGDRLVRRAHDDPVLSEAFLRVMRLEAAPTTLFRPGILARVLRPSPGIPSIGPPDTPGTGLRRLVERARSG